MRFPDFTGEWEECELRDISHISKGTGISKDQLSETGAPCILYGELYTKYKSEIISEVLSKTDIDDNHLVHSQKNDVIIPSSGETAIDISTARCVPFDGILLGGDLTIIRLQKQDGRFFSYQLNGVRKLDIAKVAQGVSVVHLYGESLKRLKVKYPSIEEQNKIASLLSLIDERIATQSKIIEDLELLKSAIIDRFFNELTISANLLSFSEIYDKAGEGGTPDTTKPEYYEAGDIPFIKIEDLANKYIVINKDYINNLGLCKSSAWIVPEHSIIYSNGATIGAVSINTYPIATKQGIIGIVPKKGISIEYLYYLMTSSYFKRQVNRIITHGTMATAYLKDINQIKVPVPCIFEQEKIANILCKVSDKVEIEQTILSHWLAQKQYFISHIFI